MNAQEAAALCRFTKSCCPAQKFDEYSPDAWHLILDDIDFGPAKDAIVALSKAQVFIAPAEIRSEVSRHYREATVSLNHIIPPQELADLPAREHAWVRELRRAFVNGATERQAVVAANASQGIAPEPEPLAITSGPAAVAQLKGRMVEEATRLALVKNLATQERAEKAERFRAMKAKRAESEQALRDEAVK